MDAHTDYRRSANVILDITLYFEIALLAWILFMWNAPTRALPRFYEPARHAVRP